MVPGVRKLLFPALLTVALAPTCFAFIPSFQRSLSSSSPLKLTNAAVPVAILRATSKGGYQVDKFTVHVGNLNWNASCDNVRNYLAKVTAGLDVQDIFIKPITNKPRDAGKEHGGSATITFGTIENADIAMKRFKDKEVQIVTEGDHDKDSNMGCIKVRWATRKVEQSTGEDSEASSNSNELSQERMLHRKRRAEKYAKKRRTIAQNTDKAIEYLRTSNFFPDQVRTLNAPKLDWTSDRIPSQIDPMRGGGIRMDTDRGRRKQAQVEAFLYVLKESLLDLNSDSCADGKSLEHHPRNPNVVADLGSGAGNLSIPIAWFLQEEANDSTNFLAIDINNKALERLNQRANAINVNINTRTEDLMNLNHFGTARDDDPLKFCSAILSLHACGAASDLAIECAVSRSIPFAVSPCCIGKAKTIRKPDQMPSIVSSSQRSGAPENITYPRSETLKNIINNQVDYNLILAAADYSANVGKLDIDNKENDLHAERGKMAKRIVEMDRLKWAEERGYHVQMMEIPRLGKSYAKRELLIGAKKGTLAASRISKLSSSTQLFAHYDTDGDNDGVDISDENETVEEPEDQMDLAGFVGYLAPYALALIISIGATVAFFKFVLMDY